MASKHREQKAVDNTYGTGKLGRDEMTMTQTAAYRPSDLATATVDALRVEAGSAGDGATVRDCDAVLYWLSSGAAAMGVRCRAAVRIARILTDAAAHE